MERNDLTQGVGTAYIGSMNRVIEPLGECKPPWRIAAELAERMGLDGYLDKSEEEVLEERARQQLPGPFVAFKEQIEDPANHPFPTPSGKIEIYSQQWEELGIEGLPPLPRYFESWEGRSDPLAEKYPLQLITTHFKRRALSQFENIPWLREIQEQALLMNASDAEARGIRNGDMVRVFNDRGETVIRARVTERIMPGVVDLPHGAWYAPDEKGVDRAGCANVLTSEEYSPGGSFPYNTALVQVEKLD